MYSITVEAPTKGELTTKFATAVDGDANVPQSGALEQMLSIALGQLPDGKVRYYANVQLRDGIGLFDCRVGFDV